VHEAGWDVPIYLARELLLGVKREDILSTSYEVFRKRSAEARRQLSLVVNEPGVMAIHPEEIFCDTFLPGRCVNQLDGDPLYVDDDHLNSIGAAMLSQKVVRAMKEKGWLGEAETPRLGTVKLQD